MLATKNPCADRRFLAAMAAIAGMAVLAFGADAQDSSPLASIVPDEEAGAELYNSICKGCHGVSIAPTLRGIINRPIASVESFAGYSDALKTKKSMTWTVANLDAFLKSAPEFAPGTLMTQAIPEPQKRADLIAYLASLPPPR